jgi:hypothetical protein
MNTGNLSSEQLVLPIPLCSSRYIRKQALSYLQDEFPRRSKLGMHSIAVFPTFWKDF